MLSEGNKIYRDYSSGHQLTDKHIFDVFATTTDYVLKDDYAGALKTISTLDTLSHSNSYKYNVLYIKSSLFEKLKQFEAAAATLAELDSTIDGYTGNLREGLRDIQNHLARKQLKFYKLIGDDKLATDLLLKKYKTGNIDFINSDEAMAINKSRSLYELRKLDDQIIEVNRQKDRMTAIAIVCVISLIIVSIFVWYIIKKNRELDRKNKVLFRQYENMSKLSETTNTRVQEQENAKRYANSSVSDEQKSRIYNAILECMENDPDVYSPDFSLDRLAEKVNSKPKYVSQVINEMTQMSFSSLIAEYRIRKASRELASNSNYTIETIAKSVGYKSAGYFSRIFRDVTGMLPSEYIKMSSKMSNN